ncbi:hypothetical protein NPIL_373831 [Nephila pilipes]|uniref:Uncharacterized protein n=1 Tax=Nephila pilipes TaxID=299642 RepID=A0A8X6P2A8_NEPPI|nr:hypothetical protein NPIL_373831 [Nephila pilipes]
MCWLHQTHQLIQRFTIHLVNYANPNGARPFDKLPQFAACRGRVRYEGFITAVSYGGDGFECSLCSVKRTELRRGFPVSAVDRAGTTRQGRKDG